MIFNRGKARQGNARHARKSNCFIQVPRWQPGTAALSRRAPVWFRGPSSCSCAVAAAAHALAPPARPAALTASTLYGGAIQVQARRVGQKRNFKCVGVGRVWHNILRAEGGGRRAVSSQNLTKSSTSRQAVQAARFWPGHPSISDLTQTREGVSCAPQEQVLRYCTFTRNYV